MRGWTPINTRDVQDAHVQRHLEDIDLFLRSIDRIVGSAIEVGNNPGAKIDASGSNFWYKPGLAGGQIGYGGINPGNDAQIISTAHGTRGSVLLGAVGDIGVDDINDLFGVGTISPASRLHVLGRAATFITYVPTITIAVGGAPQWYNEPTHDGNIHTAVATSGDSNYAQTSASSTSTFEVKFGTLVDPGIYTGIILRFRLRRNVAVSSQITYSFVETSTPRQGGTVTGLTDSFDNYDVPITEATALSIGNWTDMRVQVNQGGDAGVQVQVDYIALIVPGGGPGDEIVLRVQGGNGQTEDLLQIHDGTVVRGGWNGNYDWFIADSGGDKFILQAPSLGGDITFILPAADGSSGQALITNGAGTLSFGNPTPAAHDLLSTSHGDTTAGTVSKGDLVIGQGSPATWQRKVLGTSGYCLESDGTDADWADQSRTRSVWFDCTQFRWSSGTSSAVGLWGLHPDANQYQGFKTAPASAPQGQTANWVVPQDWKAGTDMTVYYFLGTDGYGVPSGLEDAESVWNFYYKSTGGPAGTGDLFFRSAGTKMTKHVVSKLATGAGGDINQPNYLYIIQIGGDNSTPSTIASGNLTKGEKLRLAVERDTTDSADTHSALVELRFLGMMIEYTSER